MTQHLRYKGSNLQEQKYIDSMRHATNTTTIHLTLLSALEATIPDLSTRKSISIHIFGAAGFESTSLPAFEELLHLLPSLSTLRISLVGLHTQPLMHPTLPCCTTCTQLGRSISLSAWRGTYHAFIDTQLHEKPDLAAAFHAGFAVDEQASWRPTIEYIARAPHHTVFTAAREFEVRGEIEVWGGLGAEFVRGAEVNRWRGLAGQLAVCGEKRNEVSYVNYWWYIVKGKMGLERY
jgi:splicing suppressor protein 51